jgi:hypothetical protein
MQENIFKSDFNDDEEDKGRKRTADIMNENILKTA